MSAISLLGQASASLNDRVTDPKRGPVAGAAVIVTNAVGGTARDTVTNGEGLYNVPSLVPGNYDIKVTALGFSSNETKGVELQITNSAGVPAGIGDARGNDLFMMSARVSRIFPFGRDGRYKIAAFGELYNITDRANFGTSYGSVQGAATYRLPTGYIGGFGAVSTTPNSFQAQFGARVTF